MTATVSCFLSVDTSFGPVAVVWSAAAAGPRVSRIFLTPPGEDAHERLSAEYPDGRRGSTPEMDGLARGIAQFLSGRAVAFDLGLCRMDLCTGFQRRVLDAEHRIPRGRVMTYGALAAAIGSPRAVRAVGGALAHNPFPIVIPCHRAVRSDGSVGGFQGGGAMKRALLEMEGVGFGAGGRVFPEYQYRFSAGDFT